MSQFSHSIGSQNQYLLPNSQPYVNLTRNKLSCTVFSHRLLFSRFNCEMSNEGLFAVAQDNLDFFRAIERSCYNDFVQIFESIVNNLGVIDKIANEVKTFAPEFDFDESSPGNGYRTFLYFYEKCLHRLLKICSKVQAKRQSIFFSKCVVAG